MIQTVHCVDMLAGGVASVLFTYAAACKNTKFNFISISPVDDAARKKADAIGCRILADGIRSFRELSDAIREAQVKTGADVFHVHRNWHNLLPAVLAKKSGYRIVISHSHNVFKSDSFLKDIYHILFKALIGKCCDACWGCSPEAIDFLYGRSPNNPLFLPNPISFERFHYSEAARKRTRTQLGFNDEFVIVHSGLAIPQKNHEFLLRVFADLHNQRPDAKLLLLGPSFESDTYLANVADSLEIRDSVVCCGYVANTEDFYSAADLFMFPSINEGLSLSLCEAQAEGLSFIASNTITKSSNLFGNGVFLPIDEGVGPWVQTALAWDGKRHLPSKREIEECRCNIDYAAPRLDATYELLLAGKCGRDIAALWDSEA